MFSRNIVRVRAIHCVSNGDDMQVGTARDVDRFVLRWRSPLWSVNESGQKCRENPEKQNYLVTLNACRDVIAAEHRTSRQSSRRLFSPLSNQRQLDHALR